MSSGRLGPLSKQRSVSCHSPIDSLISQGPLVGSFPILSLRTNKADVVVGVEREVAEKLDASGEQWRVDGRFVTDHSHSVF